MFFFDDPRKHTTVMRKRDGKGEKMMDTTPMKPEIVKDENHEPDGKHLAAQDILAAHHSGSAEDLNEALSNFLDLHYAGSHREEG